QPGKGIWNGRMVVWVHPDGLKGSNTPPFERLLKAGVAVCMVEVFRAGETKQEINKNFAGYTFGYNRPLLANRVHDILTAVAWARLDEKTKKVDLVGFDAAGPWVLLARPLCGDTVARTAADVNGFRFDKVGRVDDEMMLPGE